MYHCSKPLFDAFVVASAVVRLNVSKTSEWEAFKVRMINIFYRFEKKIIEISLFPDKQKFHDKKYDTEDEEQRRFNIYLENKRKMDEHNENYKNGKVNYMMYLNELTDLTQDEFNNHKLTSK